MIDVTYHSGLYAVRYRGNCFVFLFSLNQYVSHYHGLTGQCRITHHDFTISQVLLQRYNNNDLRYRSLYTCTHFGCYVELLVLHKYDTESTASLRVTNSVGEPNLVAVYAGRILASRR